MSAADGMGVRLTDWEWIWRFLEFLRFAVVLEKQVPGNPGNSWGALEAVFGTLGNSKLRQDGTGSVVGAIWAILEAYWDDFVRRRSGGGSQGPPEAPGGPPGAQGPRTNYRVLLNHSCRVSAPSGTESLAWSPVRISAVIGPESVVSRWEHGGLGIGVTAQPIPRQPKPAQGAPPRRPKRPPRRPKRPPRRPQDGPHAAPLPQGGEEGGGWRSGPHGEPPGSSSRTGTRSGLNLKP